MAQMWITYVGDIPIVGTEKKDVEFITALCHEHLKLVEIGRLLGRIASAVAELSSTAPIARVLGRLAIAISKKKISSATIGLLLDVLNRTIDEHGSSAAVGEPNDFAIGQFGFFTSAIIKPQVKYSMLSGDLTKAFGRSDSTTGIRLLLDILRVAIPEDRVEQESSASADEPTSSADIGQLLDILKRAESISWLFGRLMVAIPEDEAEQESSAAIGGSTDVATGIATEHVSSAAIGGSVSIPEEWVYGFVDQFVLKGVTKEAVMKAVKGTKGKSGNVRYGKWPEKTTTPQSHAPQGGAQGGAEGGAQGGTPQSGATRGGAGKQKTSKRPSAHVINTNVLRVFRNMIDKFRNFRPANEIDANNTPTSYLAYHCEADYCPLPNMRRAIQDMKVDPDEDYIDVNATTYGWSIAKLNEAVVCFMIHLCDHPNAPRRRMYRQVKRCVSEINNETLYVDRVARLLWLAGGDQERLDMYSEAKDAVERMFQFLAANKGKVRSWVGELKL